MTKVQKILIGAGVVVVLGVVVAASALSKGGKAKGEEVYMAKAAKKDIIAAVSASGRIQPRTKVNVQSSVIGEIVQLPVKEGDAVRKGDLLVQIDPDRYKSEVDRLEANLRMGRIAIEQQEASLENLRRTLRRNQALFADRLVSPELLERNELEVLTAEINLKSLTEQVSQADASLAKARDELRKTTLISPIDGIVTKLNAEKGEMTLTGTMNNPGTVIMVVSDMGEILSEVDVDETRIVQVEPGQTARVVVDAVGETHPYAGKVAEIGGTATRVAGQEIQVFPVKIAIEKPDRSLRPGMTAKAKIETKRADGAVTIPIQSVMLKPVREVDEILASRAKKAKDKDPKDKKASAPKDEKAEAAAATSPVEAKKDGSSKDDKQELVYRVVDGKAVLTRVRAGISDETNVAILEGIKEGDQVITGPYRAMTKLKDGDAVREKTAQEADKKEQRQEEGAHAEVRVD